MKLATGFVWWRYKNGHPEWRRGYKSYAGDGLWRMGLWNGDTDHGPIVDLHDVEIKP